MTWVELSNAFFGHGYRTRPCFGLPKYENTAKHAKEPRTPSLFIKKACMETF